MNHTICSPALLAECCTPHHRLGWRIALPDPAHLASDIAVVLVYAQAVVLNGLQREDPRVRLSDVRWEVEPCLSCQVDRMVPA